LSLSSTLRSNFLNESTLRLPCIRCGRTVNKRLRY
jgi:hypothetical protein